MHFVAGFLVVIGLILLVLFGFAKTFLWNNYVFSNVNLIILSGFFSGILLFVIGIIALSFLSKDCLKNRL